MELETFMGLCGFAPWMYMILHVIYRGCTARKRMEKHLEQCAWNKQAEQLDKMMTHNQLMAGIAKIEED